MVLLSVFSLPIMNYKTLFFAEKILQLIKPKCIISEILFPRERKKKRNKKNKYKEEIKTENKGKSLTVSSSCSNFLGFQEDVHQADLLPKPYKMQLKL